VSLTALGEKLTALGEKLTALGEELGIDVFERLLADHPCWTFL